MNILATATTVGLIFAMEAPVAAAQQVYAYPKKGQSEAQQAKDHKTCHHWAVQHAGFDPDYVAPPQQQTGGVVRGAGRGALIGAVGGAIGGNAGRGAAIGAGTGALVGGIRQNQQNRAAAQQQQAQLASFNSALATCLRGRGYTVN